jgi:hypothetical protein
MIASVTYIIFMQDMKELLIFYVDIDGSNHPPLQISKHFLRDNVNIKWQMAIFSQTDIHLLLKTLFGRKGFLHLRKQFLHSSK